MIDEFIKKFTTEKVAYEQQGDAFYIIPKKLKAIRLNSKPVREGLFLGCMKGGKFIPAFPLLDILAKSSQEKVWVKDIGEMDFLYGKNLRRRQIKSIEGTPTVGFLKLVMNEHQECLGYGKVVKEWDADGNIFKNILDRGDFLRREKH